ncbi:MAG TPA: tetratricopeptide repeat protein [Thermodesulfovibrionales bacterium]|nr:tetratricopeptide repeat protein [Thermodesulfovibrionales bacterium]
MTERRNYTECGIVKLMDSLPGRKKKASGYRTAGDKTSESFHEPDDRQLSSEGPAEKAGKVRHLPLLISSVSVITFIVYLSSLHNDFIKHWDDKPYVYNNPHIRSFDWDFIKWAFTDFYEANWHPLTWVSHALDYAMWGLNPVGHHLTNVIFHAANTALVVLISVRLLKLHRERVIKSGAVSCLKERGILIAGAVIGLLFGLHPIHVESVAWVAERKDLLCGLFFLLSIMMYLKYDRVVPGYSARVFPFRSKYYLLTFGFFVLALLSKPMAVSLPAVMLILDWYPLRRIQSLKSFRVALVEKIPFITLSLLSSIVTMHAQKAAMELMRVVPLSTRVLVAAKSILTYLSKLVVPINLIPYYPYPQDVSLSSVEYPLAIAGMVGITGAFLVLSRRNTLFLAAWSYYLITLLPVLGIVQVGAQSMADRYLYLPSISLFAIAGIGAAWGWIKVGAARKRRLLLQFSYLFVIATAFISLTYLTLAQIRIWRDSLVFWNYVIEKEPSTIPLAYFNRANALVEAGQLDKAFADFDEAIALNPYYYDAYNNRGSTYDQIGRLDRALDDYNKASTLNQNDPQIFVNRGLVYLKLGRAQPAIADFNRACELGDSFGCNAPRYLK